MATFLAANGSCHLIVIFLLPCYSCPLCANCDPHHSEKGVPSFEAFCHGLFLIPSCFCEVFSPFSPSLCNGFRAGAHHQTVSLNVVNLSSETVTVIEGTTHKRDINLIL